ncbi:hypothetical protein CDAR_571621 [Caerostris darwini]|uniref:Uncharacterized protein n=1 Tax=Caerostris darwini TaxID=1538125 RepID=A0AAV4WFK0_9ARAC|nr:hypothetical protein CDAR_571621 [Caerostris darwini]
MHKRVVALSFGTKTIVEAYGDSHSSIITISEKFMQSYFFLIDIGSSHTNSGDARWKKTPIVLFFFEILVEVADGRSLLGIGNVRYGITLLGTGDMMSSVSLGKDCVIANREICYTVLYIHSSFEKFEELVCFMTLIFTK